MCVGANMYMCVCVHVSVVVFFLADNQCRRFDLNAKESQQKYFHVDRS